MLPSNRNIDEEALAEVAKEFGKPLFVVRAVCHYPFRFLKAIMREFKGKNMGLPHFGKFVVKPYRRKTLGIDKDAIKDTERFVEFLEKERVTPVPEKNENL